MPNISAASERASKLTLTELRHVLHLHQTLSFNRAAEMAGVSQSALSQSISRIEKRLGVVLFNRSRRSVSATAFADLIAERAVSIVNMLEDMDSRIGALRDSREGGVRFGMGVVPAALMLSGAIAKFHEGHARTEVRAIVDYPDELVALATANDVEFLVAADLPQFRNSETVHERLFEYEHVAVCRPGHPLTELNFVDFRNFIRYPVVSFPTRYLRNQMLELVETSDEFDLLDRNFPTVQVQQPSLLAGMVASSDFVMLAPAVLVEEWIDAGRLVARKISDLRAVVGVDLIWKEGVSLSPASQAMIDILRALAASRRRQQEGQQQE